VKNFHELYYLRKANFLKLAAIPDDGLCMTDWQSSNDAVINSWSLHVVVRLINQAVLLYKVFLQINNLGAVHSLKW